MYACPTQEWYVYSVSYPEKDGIVLFSKHYPTTIWDALPPSTSQGKWFPSPILTTYTFQFNWGDSDSRYMMTSGPCPIFKEIAPKWAF